MTLQEVSMVGVSYGGLTSCYAATALPSYFRRVYCMSPSVWWNYQQLPNLIMANGQTNGLPLSIVIYIGSLEMTDEETTNVNKTSFEPWFIPVNDTANAFLSIGLPSNALYFFTADGGNHDYVAWTTNFALGIVKMYTPNFTSIYQKQYQDNVNIIYPITTSVVTPIVINNNDDNNA